MKNILNIYRKLPLFRSKLRIGKLLFNSMLDKEVPIEFLAHQSIKYKIPNTIENLGIELLINGVYEKKVVNFLKKRIKGGDTFFDVGANIGSIGLPVIKSSSNIKYYGFEASPRTFEYLKTNFSLNNMQNVELHNNLIHAEENKGMKFYDAVKYGKSSLSPSYSQEFIYVNSTSLDIFCAEKKIETINLIKVDVQGYELYVFEGMKNLLSEKRVKNIVFEFEDWAERDANLEIGSAQKYLLSMGYHLYNLDGSRLQHALTKGEAMIWAKPIDN